MVKNIQVSEVETLIDLLQEGRPIHTGIAIFTPSADLKGNLKFNVRMDKCMVAMLNASGAFTGNIRNRENIGKTSQELAQNRNNDHPEDPIKKQERTRP